jgi:YidC/Oxa1 family membrane protein insertase
VSILNPLFEAVAWVIMQIHAGLAVPFGASSGWAWGLSIVILVMLMRLIMVPLFVKQVKSQRKMLQHMPQLRELQKRYKGDRQRLNEETMKFYKENGINPLGGCLPLVAQLPVFWALFNVLRGIADWQPGHTPQYGLTVPVVESARHAHVFGVLLSDKFLFAPGGEPWSAKIVILLSVLVSAGTTFLTMRQSQKRGMMQQPAADPNNPMANSQKYMMYIAPFFALTGLYWQYGLVLYWVTTNLWTLGQQHVLFRNMPVVGSDAAGATAPAGAKPAAKSAVKSAAAKPGTKPAAKSGAAARAGGSAKAGSGGQARTASRPAAGAKTAGAKTADGRKSGKAGVNGSGAQGSSTQGSSTQGSATQGSMAAESSSGMSGARALLRLGRNKEEPEEAEAAPQPKTVRQQQPKQTRSKRSGKR